eukprot:TRINITY_DN6626_c1_g2_i1.p1 TRINITY_DN6626_c1_g2~~TRINITY_DN6626_c1_g2_i1.p1  ORF type:complete len:184 (-),score=26.26 TRINITY_DN6626_c1_g2_i1:22-573(-)
MYRGRLPYVLLFSLVLISTVSCEAVEGRIPSPLPSLVGDDDYLLQQEDDRLPTSGGGSNNLSAPSHTSTLDSATLINTVLSAVTTSLSLDESNQNTEEDELLQLQLQLQQRQRRHHDDSTEHISTKVSSGDMKKDSFTLSESRNLDSLLTFSDDLESEPDASSSPSYTVHIVFIVMAIMLTLV